MGWGIDFKADIYLSKQDYKTKGEVEYKIEELEGLISVIKEKLLMYSTSNPKDIIPIEWNEQPIDWIYNQTNELFNDLLTYHRELIDLRYYLEYLNNK